MSDLVIDPFAGPGGWSWAWDQWEYSRWVHRRWLCYRHGGLDGGNDREGRVTR